MSKGEIVNRLSKTILFSALLASAMAAADQVVDDNLIIQGKQCIGTDCVNGEAFGDETIRLKENNLRIRLHDTTVEGDVLGQSWNIAANDFANGGAAYMSFELKSLVPDIILLSDGTAPLYDCSDLLACFPDNACPIVGVIPAGEPVTDAFCNPLPPIFTQKPVLQLVTDNVRTGEVEDGVSIGTDSDPVDGAVSVGRADLVRRIANLADGINATDALAAAALNGYVPFAEQAALVDDLNQQLDAIDMQLDELEAIIYNAEIEAVSFGDVPSNYWALPFIQKLAANGISAGCGNGNYCPTEPVTRAQMAVFLVRAIHGSGFNPPPATGTTFMDVGAGDFAARFIEQLFVDGITSGCGGGNYCPDAEVTRAQMAVFLLRAKFGSGYTPPPATGVFGDAPPGSFAAAWIEQLAAEGITSGCGGGDYCPDALVTRDQMAVFIVRAFDL